MNEYTYRADVGREMPPIGRYRYRVPEPLGIDYCAELSAGGAGVMGPMCIDIRTRNLSFGDVVDVVNWAYDDRLRLPNRPLGGWVAAFGNPVNAHGTRLSVPQWMIEKVSDSTPVTPIEMSQSGPKDYPWLLANWPIIPIGAGIILAGVLWYYRKAIGRYFAK